MSFQVRTVCTVSKSWFLFCLLISFLLIISHGSITVARAASSSSKLTNIGAIIDVNSRIGKEEKTAMEIAVQNFNNHSKNHKLSLHFQDPAGRDPLQAAYATEELIKQKQVQVIVGMHSWQDAALVANIASKAQVPFLSFAAAAITPQLMPHRWPFLIQMANNGSDQIKFIADIIRSYNWRRVIAIYEEDAYGGDSGTLALLSEALVSISSEIEYRMALPPFSSLSDPKAVVQEELVKVRKVAQSRVFVVLQSSLSMATHLFREAKRLECVERDSAWIITNSIASFLDTFNTSVISSMEGVLGIKTYFPENTTPYKEFEDQFMKKFKTEFHEEDDFQPGIHALRAYDSIRTISQATKRMNSNISDPQKFLESILSSNFTGLSGEIRFETRQLSHSPIYRTVNVVGKKYKELDFWMPEFGFLESIDESGEKNESHGKGLDGLMIWPGNTQGRVPKGWAMPTVEKPMVIGVPDGIQFVEFMKVDNTTENPDEKFTGFCIDLFKMVRDLIQIQYELPYTFVAFDGSYDELVLRVHDKTYDAVVGDITILSSRSKYVEFTQPYAESGLTMVVPANHRDPTWLFTKPFSSWTWVVTGAILIYTMFIVWFLEHQSNPEFKGPWKNQLATVFWFTFCSLFFAQREKIYSNYTRVVVVVWLFVVFILSSSYTASLSSMLTVEQLEPSFDMSNNLKIGCDGDSFVRKYLENVLHYKSENIINVSTKDDYPNAFKSGNISAAFLEVPYQKVFLNKYCKGYKATKATYRFGGLGFVFQKGSPIATDVSEAILTLSEHGDLLALEEKWLTPSNRCSANATSTGNLSLQNFWSIYLLSGATSTICSLLFLVRLLKKYQRHREADEGNLSPGNKTTAWNKALSLAKFFYNGEINSPAGKAPTITQAPDIEEWSSSRWVYVSPSGNTPDHAQASLPAEIEMT